MAVQTYAKFFPASAFKQAWGYASERSSRGYNVRLDSPGAGLVRVCFSTARVNPDDAINVKEVAKDSKDSKVGVGPPS